MKLTSKQLVQNAIGKAIHGFDEYNLNRFKAIESRLLKGNRITSAEKKDVISYLSNNDANHMFKHVSIMYVQS